MGRPSTLTIAAPSASNLTPRLRRSATDRVREAFTRLSERRESDQLPEEQPAEAAPGHSTPEERRRQAGTDPEPEPTERPNTGNPRDE